MDHQPVYGFLVTLLDEFLETLTRCFNQVMINSFKSVLFA